MLIQYNYLLKFVLANCTQKQQKKTQINITSDPKLSRVNKIHETETNVF